MIVYFLKPANTNSFSGCSLVIDILKNYQKNNHSIKIKLISIVAELLSNT